MNTLKKIILGTFLAIAPLISAAGLSDKELEQKWNEARVHPEQRQSFLEQLTNSIPLPTNITSVVYIAPENISSDNLRTVMRLDSEATITPNGFSNFKAVLEFYPNAFSGRDSYIQNFNDLLANINNHELKHCKNYLGSSEAFRDCLNEKGEFNLKLWDILSELEANKSETDALVSTSIKSIILKQGIREKYSIHYIKNSLDLAKGNYADLTNYLEHADMDADIKEKLKTKYNFPFLKYGHKKD